MPKQDVSTPLALEAISTDLDAMAEEIATVAGNQASSEQLIRDTREEIRGVAHKLDTLIDLVRMRILPAVDEVDNHRARIQAVENRVDRLVRERSGLDAE